MIESPPSTPPVEDPERPERINPALFIDRELSWLAFNRRVLEEAEDVRRPLLERLKFVAIFSANLDRRVETLFPIEDPQLRRYLRDRVLETYLRDTAQARELQPDGAYRRPAAGDDLPQDAQRWLLEQASERSPAPER